MDLTGWMYVSTGRTDRMMQWGLFSVPITLASFLIGLPWGGVGVALCFSISRYLLFFPSFWWAIRGTNVTMADILGVVATPTLLAVVVALCLRAVTDQVGPLLDLAAASVAGLAYLCVIAAALWRLPPYQRLRERASEYALKARDFAGRWRRA